jgi:hypothetical protein
MKTLDEQRKAISQAISRAYGVSLWPVDIRTEHAGRDPREYVNANAGRPHPDVTVDKLAALALSRARLASGDEALASTIADLIDGGISLDRQAASPRELDTQMARHRRLRAQKNPLPSDLRAKARRDAPAVVRRGGGSAIKVANPVATTTRIGPGSRVVYRRLDDETEHEVVLSQSNAPSTPTDRSVPLGSPLGKALLGATKGTIVAARLGSETVEIEVVSVG